MKCKSQIVECVVEALEWNKAPGRYRNMHQNGIQKQDFCHVI